MVIETIPHGVIPFRCERCMTVYLWKPSIADGFCGEAQCPVCKTRHNQERIGNFRYKLIRALKGK